MGPTSSAVAVDAVVDPFQSSFDPFGVGEQDAKSKVMSLYHQGDPQQQPTQPIQQMQMQVAAPPTGFTDPFAPYHAQDPFMPAQQMQQMQPQPAQRMQLMQMQMQMQQQALSVQ